jgi:GDP-L-fucose synthase
MYSDDMGDACVFLMEREDEAISSVLDPQTSIINIGTGEDITIGELSQKVAETVGFNGEIEWDATKPDGAPRKLLNVSRLHHLGWRHKTSLQEGLRLSYQDFVGHSTR